MLCGHLSVRGVDFVKMECMKHDGQLTYSVRRLWPRYHIQESSEARVLEVREGTDDRRTVCNVMFE